MNSDKKLRDSNLELLRIIAMLLVLMVHAGFKALDAPTVAEVLTSPVSSFLRFLSESLSIICVNVFVLITGWFGIRPKVSRFCGLVFQVMFIGLFIYLVLLLLGKVEIWGVAEWGRLLILRRGLWFVGAYMVLYIISPILNAFVATADKKTFRNVLIAFFAIQTVYGISSQWAFFFSGYSPLSFAGLYLLARYMKLYPARFSTLKKGYDAAIYFCTVLFTASLSMVFGWVGHDAEVLYEYLSPSVIVSSVYFFLFFTKLSFHSKAVNYVASSAFAVYLFHCDPLFFIPYYLVPIKHFYLNDSLPLFLLHTTALIISVFLVSILVDKIRLFVWNRIHLLEYRKTKPAYEIG
jgi:surface polysaccharide O-acyltransferase-like enzyme